VGVSVPSSEDNGYSNIQPEKRCPSRKEGLESYFELQLAHIPTRFLMDISGLYFKPQDQNVVVGFPFLGFNFRVNGFDRLLDSQVWGVVDQIKKTIYIFCPN